MHTAETLLPYVYKFQFELNEQKYGDPCTVITMRARDIPGLRTFIKVRVFYFPQYPVLNTITRGINHALDCLAQHVNAGVRTNDQHLLTFEVRDKETLFGEAIMPQLTEPVGNAAPWVQYCQIDTYPGLLHPDPADGFLRNPGVKCYLSTGRYHHSSMFRRTETALERLVNILPHAFEGIELAPSIPVNEMNRRIKESYDPNYKLNDERGCTAN